MNFSFPSRLRIKQRTQFELALRNKALINKWFAIHLLVNDYDLPRLGMVVSKRIIPKSVYRNYAKRLIRETFRQNVFQLPNVDYIIKIRRNLKIESALEAKSALLVLLLNAQAL